MPRGEAWLIFIGVGGQGFELSFCPGVGKFAHRKNCPAVLPGGHGKAWNGLIHKD